MKRTIKRYTEWLAHSLFTPLRWLLELTLSQLKVVVLYRINGDGLGDTIAVSTVLNALNAAHGTRGIVFTKFPEIFLHNPQVIRNIDYEKMPKLARSLLKSLCKHLRGRCVMCIGGENWTPGTWPWQAQPTDAPNPVYMDGLQPDPRYRVDTRKFVPRLALSDEERRHYAERFADLPAVFGLIKASVGVNRHSAAMLKDWSHEGMQGVVDRNPSIAWVQIGTQGEQRLDGVIDLLGKTSLRDLFYLFSRARITLTVEGMVSHGAVAFGQPVVVVFSGMHDPQGLCYPNTLPVSAPSRPACAPCWKSACPLPEKICTTTISVDAVDAAVKRGLHGVAPKPHVITPASRRWPD